MINLTRHDFENHLENTSNTIDKILNSIQTFILEKYGSIHQNVHCFIDLYNCQHYSPSSTLLVGCLVVLVAMFCALLCCCICPSSTCCACWGKLIRRLKRKVVIFLVGQNHKDNTHQLIVEDNFSFSLVFGYSFNGNLQIQRLYLSFLQATFIFAIFMFLCEF